MGLFWKRRKRRALTAKQENAANRMASAIVRRQTRLANYLNRKTQYWNKASKLLLLALLILLLGGFSLYQFIQLFTN
jgi:hypothetical protein